MTMRDLVVAAGGLYARGTPRTAMTKIGLPTGRATRRHSTVTVSATGPKKKRRRSRSRRSAGQQRMRETTRRSARVRRHATKPPRQRRGVAAEQGLRAVAGVGDARRIAGDHDNHRRADWRSEARRRIGEGRLISRPGAGKFRIAHRKPKRSTPAPCRVGRPENLMEFNGRPGRNPRDVRVHGI